MIHMIQIWTDGPFEGFYGLSVTSRSPSWEVVEVQTSEHRARSLAGLQVQLDLMMAAAELRAALQPHLELIDPIDGPAAGETHNEPAQEPELPPRDPTSPRGE